MHTLVQSFPRKLLSGLVYLPEVNSSFLSKHFGMTSKSLKSRSQSDMGDDSPSKKMKPDPDSVVIDGKTKLSDDDFIRAIQSSRLACGSNVIEFAFNKKRVRTLTPNDEMTPQAGGILYWMSRDQRVQDNWAFLYAQRLALKMKLPLQVSFCLVDNYLNAPIRHYAFLLKGLREVEQECKSLGINFHLLRGEPHQSLPDFVKANKVSAVVCDHSPLRVPTNWCTDLVKALPNGVPLCQVDAHNVVPVWVTSDKQEYAARTIRRKIHDKLPEFLTHFPPVVNHVHSAVCKPEPIDWDLVRKSLKSVDQTVGEVDWAVPGTQAGLCMLNEFCRKRLKDFGALRNDPTKRMLSNLSPWFHFGQISVQRAILTVKKFTSYKDSVDSFVEESLVRRELSDNYCFYNRNYDQLSGAASWAQQTLREHMKDKRDYLYSDEQFEKGKTHDKLWNAAQLQLVREGKMHGFMRMYWAKKILEWSFTPEDALRIALYLNDRYSLDGRDPNGYVGCLWSIAGLHDQGWAERQVFGKIRFMNEKGCQRKFDVSAYITTYH